MIAVAARLNRLLEYLHKLCAFCCSLIVTGEGSEVRIGCWQNEQGRMKPGRRLQKERKEAGGRADGCRYGRGWGQAPQQERVKADLPLPSIAASVGGVAATTAAGAEHGSSVAAKARGGSKAGCPGPPASICTLSGMQEGVPQGGLCLRC